MLSVQHTPYRELNGDINSQENSIGQNRILTFFKQTIGQIKLKDTLTGASTGLYFGGLQSSATIPMSIMMHKMDNKPLLVVGVEGVAKAAIPITIEAISLILMENKLRKATVITTLVAAEIATIITIIINDHLPTEIFSQESLKTVAIAAGIAIVVGAMVETAVGAMNRRAINRRRSQQVEA